MLTQLVHPRCEFCGASHRLLFHCDAWDGLIVCLGCIRSVATWLVKENLADENPLCEALLAGNSVLDTNESIRVYVNGDGDFDVGYDIKRVAKDKRKTT